MTALIPILITYWIYATALIQMLLAAAILLLPGAIPLYICYRMVKYISGKRKEETK